MDASFLDVLKVSLQLLVGDPIRCRASRGHTTTVEGVVKIIKHGGWKWESSRSTKEVFFSCAGIWEWFVWFYDGEGEKFGEIAEGIGDLAMRNFNLAVIKSCHNKGRKVVFLAFSSIKFCLCALSLLWGGGWL